jgi:hypothetical protein
MVEEVKADEHTFFFIDLLLERLDIGNSPCLDLLNHLLIPIKMVEEVKARAVTYVKSLQE